MVSRYLCRKCTVIGIWPIGEFRESKGKRIRDFINRQTENKNDIIDIGFQDVFILLIIWSISRGNVSNIELYNINRFVYDDSKPIHLQPKSSLPVKVKNHKSHTFLIVNILN